MYKRLIIPILSQFISIENTSIEKENHFGFLLIYRALFDQLLILTIERKQMITVLMVIKAIINHYDQRNIKPNLVFRIDSYLV